MSAEEYSSKDFDHLGIVSAMCDEINLVNSIDQLIPPDPRAIITTGESVKLMIINGLGFTTRPLYLEAQFYASKPIERFLGRPCASEEISDNRLGRSLDSCFNYGCTSIFSTLALCTGQFFSAPLKTYLQRIFFFVRASCTLKALLIYLKDEISTSLVFQIQV